MAGTLDVGGGSGGHAVLFYRDEDEFAGRVSGFLLDAIRQGGAAVAIATAPHRAAISARLAQAGADLLAAQAAGRYVTLDAQQTLHRFVSADWPSPAHFWQVASPLVARAAQAGQPVHVFGEVVALLWDAGLAGSAIEVEAMWNELGSQYPFSLLCAYPADSVSDAEHQDALAEVCRAHGSVVDGPPSPA